MPVIFNSHFQKDSVAFIFVSTLSAIELTAGAFTLGCPRKRIRPMLLQQPRVM